MEIVFFLFLTPAGKILCKIREETKLRGWGLSAPPQAKHGISQTTYYIFYSIMMTLMKGPKYFLIKKGQMWPSIHPTCMQCILTRC